MSPRPHDTISFRTIELEAQIHAVRAMCSEANLRNVEVRSHFDRVTRSMVLELREAVWQHRVAMQVEEVPFSKTVTVDLPEPRWHPGPAAVAAIGLTFGGIVAGSLVLVLFAMLAAGLGVWVASRPHPTVRREVAVSGTVAVERSLFNAFPDAPYDYPSSLGSRVQVVTFEASS